MTDEAKKIVDALRCDIECDYYMLKRCAAYKLEKDAADLIERLSEELEQVKRERDAAVNDMKILAIVAKDAYEAGIDAHTVCNLCNEIDECDRIPTPLNDEGIDCFKWRGVCEENSGGGN